MHTPLQARSIIDHEATNVQSKRISSCRQEDSADASGDLENSSTSKLNLDADDRHSWIKFESPVDLILSPVNTIQTPPSPGSVYSCDDYHTITSAPMIREEVQSYIGWTAIDAPFGNETIRLPLQLLSPPSENGATLSSSSTCDDSKYSINLSPSPSHTQNSLKTQENISPKNTNLFSRKISQTFKGCFGKSNRKET